MDSKYIFIHFTIGLQYDSWPLQDLNYIHIWITSCDYILTPSPPCAFVHTFSLMKISQAWITQFWQYSKSHKIRAKNSPPHYNSVIHNKLSLDSHGLHQQISQISHNWVNSHTLIKISHLFTRISLYSHTHNQPNSILLKLPIVHWDRGDKSPVRMTNLQSSSPPKCFH